MAMELRHLRYFIAVAEEGHITRAAQRLGIQQPPLSQQIKAIELELDVQLFHRKARGVEMTDAGRAFLEEARATLDHLDRAFETTRRASRGEQGRLCVGVTSTAPFHPLVPRAIRAFREACPMVSLTLEECLSNESVDRLRNERMDVAFIRTTLGDGNGLVVDSLLEDRWSWHYQARTPWLKANLEQRFHSSAWPARHSFFTGRQARACMIPRLRRARLWVSIRASETSVHPRSKRLVSRRR
jgi:DNA-binding transcriptional LysR family regulator